MNVIHTLKSIILALNIICYFSCATINGTNYAKNSKNLNIKRTETLYGTKQKKCEKQILALKKTVLSIKQRLDKVEAIVYKQTGDSTTVHFIAHLETIINFSALNISATETDQNTQLERKTMEELQNIRNENIDQMRNSLLDKARIIRLEGNEQAKKALKKLRLANLQKYYLKSNNCF